MHVNLGVLVLLAAASTALAQAPPAARERTVRGQVVEATSGAPLRRARVALSADGPQRAVIFTDDAGRFVLDAPSSTLNVVVTKAGFTSATRALAAATVEAALRIELARAAAVTGRVVDSFGAPMLLAYVTARSLTAERPGPFFTLADTLGEYRLGALPPGRYEISAARIPPELSTGDPKKTEELLFGNSPSLETASEVASVTLAAGDEAGGVDFMIPGEARTCGVGPSGQPALGATAGAIAGRITAVSGEPIGCAAVRILAPELPISLVYADARGRYPIEGLPAGPIVLQAGPAGYVTLQFRQSRPSDAGVPISLREGERRQDVDFVLPRLPSGSGTVVDEHGEPVQGVGVLASRLRRVDGRTLLASTTVPQSTDDRGQYRLIGLQPGTYVISALARSMVSTTATADRPRGYASTFYPGTPDASAAQQVTVDVGQDAPGIDIALAPIRTATVAGSAVDAAGRPFAGSVRIAAGGQAAAALLDSRFATLALDGGFAVPNVPAGDYIVKAVGAGDDPLFGMQYVTVADADPPPVRLVATRGATVHGRYVVEGSARATIGASAIAIAPADPDRVPGPGSGTPTMYALNDDGTFRISGVSGPGRLEIVDTACESCYLKSARIDGIDAADTPFDFGIAEKEYRDVEIVISDAGAAIEGRVTDESGPAAGIHQVVVFAVHPDLWYLRSRHVKIATSKAGIGFRVTGLPPGDYYVAVVNLNDVLIDRSLGIDPDALASLSARAPRVTVAERARQTIRVPLTRR